MKTPREILFEWHQAAEARLDALCEKVATEHCTVADQKRRPARSALSPAFVGMKLWQELVWPCRRIWLGMAAAWVVVLVFNFTGGERETVVADNAPPPTADVVIALKEQRQMLAQLLDAGAPAPADRPRVPGPRSEQRQMVMIG